MGLTIVQEKGWTEIIIEDSCEFAKFYQCVEVLNKDFGIEASSKIDGLDSVYWDFENKKSTLTIHYSIYIDISIYPKLTEKASPIDNEKIIEIGQMVFEKMNK